MAVKEIEVEGEVVEALPSRMYRVQVYDLTRGRITYRYR